MGYVSRDIAAITEPKQLTLAALPNFVTFASKFAIKVPFEYSIEVKVTQVTSNIDVVTELRITEPSGVVHIFRGTVNSASVGGSVYYVSTDLANTAENLRQALLSNAWIDANFEVRIPFTWVGTTPTNGKIIYLKSKGAGSDYNITVSAPNNTSNVAYILTSISGTINTDTISNGAGTAEIELDIYTDPAVFLGQDDRPISPAQLGNYVISLQKTYAGAPLWFDLNSLFLRYAGYAAPPDVSGWFDTNTIQVYRFIAKKRGTDNFAFYTSSALFVLNGYGRASDQIDLTEYTYGAGVFKLLTNMPRAAYVRGQKAYLNFIFADPERGASGIDDFTVQVSYRVYSTSDAYLGTVYGQPKQRSTLSIVNTCVLDIDAVIDEYPKAGIIRIGLARGPVILTNEIEYTIRPDCLHKLTEFSFLNRLGGWDAFNFDALPSTEIKPRIETFNKTITPGYTKASGIETMYTSNLEEPVTIEGAPVSNAVAEWLKEFAAARVVLDGAGNRVIIEDFKINDSSDNMQVPTFKYHLSETFTND